MSYSHKDKKFVKEIRDNLESAGYSVFWDQNISPGSAVLDTLNKEFLEADVLLAVISDSYLESIPATSELMKAIGFRGVRSKPKVLPYVIGNPDNLPINIKNIVYLKGSFDIETDMNKILSSLEKMKGEILAELQIETEEKEKIHKSFASYMENVFSTLEKKERQNKYISYVCYGISIMFLILAVIVAFLFLDSSALNEFSSMLQLSLRVFAIISLIIALSRMMFVLGKSFMVESIRNSDRRHAISFGKFFIDAYGDKASRDEIRAVFGDWNIDKGSSFIRQDSNEIDPQITNALQVITSALKKLN